MGAVALPDTTIDPSSDLGRQLVVDLARYRMVDLSHGYGPGTLYWPTSTAKFALTREASGPTPGGWFYAANSLSTPEGCARHLHNHGGSNFRVGRRGLCRV